MFLILSSHVLSKINVLTFCETKMARYGTLQVEFNNINYKVDQDLNSYDIYYRVNESEWVHYDGKLFGEKLVAELQLGKYKNVLGSSKIDYEVRLDEEVVFKDYFTICAVMENNITRSSMAPYFYEPGSTPKIQIDVIDYNLDPSPYWKITIEKDGEYITIDDEEMDEFYLSRGSTGFGNERYTWYPCTVGNCLPDAFFNLHIDEVGNYSVTVDVYEDPVKYKAKTVTDEIYIRNRMQIEYLGSDKEYYYPGEEPILNFRFKSIEDPETNYNVYVNDDKFVIHETNGEVFTCTIKIPENVQTDEFSFNYNVSVADVIWSDNNSDKLEVRSKPILSNPLSENPYIFTDDISVSVTCNDEDNNEKFNIYYKVGEGSNNFNMLPDAIDADESKQTVLKVKVDNTLLSHGNNEIFIKVVDKFRIESNIIKTDVKIVSLPSIKISGQSEFYQTGDDVNLRIEISDEDDDDYSDISYSFGDEISEPTFLQKITYQDGSKTYSGPLNTFKIPEDASAGPLTLTIFAKDSFGKTNTQKIVLMIHKKPVITPQIGQTNLVPGKSYQITFEISDGDLPNDEISISYKLGDSGDYLNALTYKDGESKEFDVSVPSDYQPGNTTIKIKAVDKFSLQDEKTLNVYIKHKPTITVDELTKTNFVGGKTVSFNGTYSDEDNDKGKVHLHSDIGDSSTEMLNSGDKFNIQLSIPADQQVGPITVNLKSEDSDGLTSADSPVTFYVRSVPKFGDCQFDKEIYKAGDSVTITCTINDNDSGDKIKYGTYDSSNDQFTKQSEIDISSSSARISFGPYQIPPDYTEPSYDVTLRVIDSYEFYSDKQIQASLKNKPIIVSKSSDKEYYLRGETINLKVFISDDDNTDSVTVTAQFGEQRSTKTQDTTKGVESEFDLSFTIPDDAEIGQMTIFISASDSSGITAGPENIILPLYFKPIIKVTSPTQIYKPSETAVISVSIEDHDAEEIVSLKYKYEGMTNYATITPSVTIDSETKSATTQVDVPLPNEYGGELQIELIGTDKHSLESSKELAPVTIRNAPQLEYNSQIQTIVQGDELKISGFIKDYDTKDTFTLFIDNSAHDTKFERTSEKTTFSIQIPISNLATGERSLDIYVKDSSNFESDHKNIVFNMRARPVVEINPINGRHQRGKQLEISFNIKDEDEGDSSIIKIKYGNKEIQSNTRKLRDEGRITTKSTFEEHKLNILIPNDSKFGESTLEIVAIDSYGYSSNPVSTTVYVLTPPQIIYHGNDRDDIKPGDNVTTLFKVKDVDGDNNITISLQLPDGTVIGQITHECIQDSNLKSSCNDKDSNLNLSIPESTSDGEYPVIAIINDTYGQFSTVPITLNVMNYQPEVEIVNKEEIQRTVFAPNETVIFNYRIRDNNTEDFSKVYIAIYNDTNITDDTIPHAIYDTTKEWSAHNYSFEIPSSFSDGKYTFTIYLVDKNGKKSKISQSTFHVDRAKGAIYGDTNLFQVLVEKRWIVIVIISLVSILALIVILVIIILLIPCGKEESEMNEEEDEHPEIADDWSEPEDSGETVSVNSDEVEEFDVNI